MDLDLSSLMADLDAREAADRVAAKRNRECAVSDVARAVQRMSCRATVRNPLNNVPATHTPGVLARPDSIIPDPRKPADLNVMARELSRPDESRAEPRKKVPANLSQLSDGLLSVINNYFFKSKTAYQTGSF